MATEERQARHVFHPETTGWDRVHAWHEATGEPSFVWGRRSGHAAGWSFRAVKREFAKWLQATAAASLTVYHDGAGADALGPMDTCPHKVLFQHHWFPRWEANFEWQIRCTGKVLTGHPDLAEALRQRFAWIPGRYIHSIPQPGLRLPIQGSGGRPPPARTGIWLHGIPWRRHGNRLRSIVDHWPADAGQLEIIAEGTGRPAWSRRDHIVWSMNMPVEFALYRIFTWDSTLLLNDFSLDAPWLMLALSRDCFPLVPDGGAASRPLAWRTGDAPCPYPWGDFPAAIALLSSWREERADCLADFRAWTRLLLPGAQPGEGFSRDWQQAKQALSGQRSPKLRSRRPVPSWYPLAWYERVQRLLAGV